MTVKITYFQAIQDHRDIPEVFLQHTVKRFARIMEDWKVSPFDAVHLVDLATYDDFVEWSRGETDNISVDGYKGAEVVLMIQDLMLQLYPHAHQRRHYIHKNTTDFEGKIPLDVMGERELLGLRQVYVTLYTRLYIEPLIKTTLVPSF